MLAIGLVACGQGKSAQRSAEVPAEDPPAKPAAHIEAPADAPASDAAPIAGAVARFVVEYDEGCPSYQCGDALPEVDLVRPARATTTSQLAGAAYGPAHLFDQDPRTAWCEGVEGPGTGQRIRYELTAPTPVAVISFTPFYAKDKDTLLGNGRVKQLRVTMEGGVEGIVELVDQEPSTAFMPGAQLDYIGPYVNLLNQGNNQPVVTRWVELEILEVYPGAKHADTCISEITLLATR